MTLTRSGVLLRAAVSLQLLLLLLLSARVQVRQLPYMFIYSFIYLALLRWKKHSLTLSSVQILLDDTS